jgi:hypothetical protein
MNVFLVSRSFEFDYRRQSFLALPVLPNWRALVCSLFDAINSNRVTVSRSREITSTVTQTQPPPSFNSDPPSLDVQADKIQMASTISASSMDLVTSAEMWYGAAYGGTSTGSQAETVYWFGQTLAELNGAEVSGSWDRRVLSVSVGSTSCAVTSYRMNAQKLRFNVRFRVRIDHWALALALDGILYAVWCCMLHDLASASSIVAGARRRWLWRRRIWRVFNRYWHVDIVPEATLG